MAELRMWRLALAGLLGLVAQQGWAADAPKPVESDVTLPDFHFHTGETMPVKLHVTTIGDKANPAVLVLHGTAGSGATMLTPAFGGAMFGPGQALDAAKYFIVLPDALGTGQSTKPSDGMRAKFPHYDYADMVSAQYRLVTEGLGIKHLRVVIGNSMGGMQTWMWGTTYPGFMDALVPMASQPTAMSSRNWMMRRMLVESIRRDPAYAGGNYTTTPPSLLTANVMFGIATSGGTLAYQSMAPTGAQADKMVEERLAAAPPGDANDFMWQWESSHDYDPSALLEKISASLLAINSADDERNPPETGTMTESLKRIKGARLLLIPASTATRGHGTTGIASFYAKDLAAFLDGLPRS